ncbi:MAG TPA: site-specific integrase [Bacteroidia bacterium]|nr:site-specific integrase [Bacteroidia bacterium]
MSIFAQNLIQRMEYVTSIILDTRRAKEKGVYPVKLRIYSTRLQKKKLYSTQYDFSKKDFASIFETEKPRNEYKELRNQLRGIELKADAVCKTLNPFSFFEFEKKFLRNTGEGANVIYQYEQTVKRLKSQNNLGTASNYELSLKSLLAFVQAEKGKTPVKLPFHEITPEWLKKYEDYMIHTLKRSRTTVGIYLRPLRAVFNTAIAEREIDAEVYPFGAKRYQIPTVRNVKKALTKMELKQLFDAVPLTPQQEKAKDFWFFSYACNGMNIKDIAQLTHSNLHGDKLIFYRAKTINTSKGDLKPVTVYLNAFSLAIIKKYGNKKANKDDYIFPIISKQETEVVNHNKVKNFTKFINQNLKKLALNIGITSDISTYWARHSFATNSIRNGASMEFVMEALSHNSMKTTKGYFAGFEDKDKKDFMEKIMDF